MQTITLPIDELNAIETSLKKALVKVRELEKERTEKTSKAWTKKQWEEAEKEADEDIAAGRVVGPFYTVEELIESLHSESKNV